MKTTKSEDTAAVADSTKKIHVLNRTERLFKHVGVDEEGQPVEYVLQPHGDELVPENVANLWMRHSLAGVPNVTVFSSKEAKAQAAANAEQAAELEKANAARAKAEGTNTALVQQLADLQKKLEELTKAHGAAFDAKKNAEFTEKKALEDTTAQATKDGPTKQSETGAAKVVKK